MKIYNTLTGKKEEFVPLQENHVSMYACGPTVYNYFHIGNARPFIFFDVVRRYFEYCGYTVNFVQNFTDVDDKIINKANEEGITPKELSEKYIQEYFIDAKGLGIRPATVHPKVSENIPEIISLIERLVDKGLAYNVGGNVYYRVNAFSDYGKLSKQSLEDLNAGARIEVNDEKESPLDFALWKKMKENEPYWESPWGKGRPGWHIECSAMSRKYLGNTIDIHGGGMDLIFPHHENEIAQSEGACGSCMAHYWMHNAYININNEKMSKSKGNFFTVRDIGKHYDLEVVRFFMLSAHYKSPLNFSDDLLQQAQNGMERLYNLKENLLFMLEKTEHTNLTADEETWLNQLQLHKTAFKEAMDDDFNTANAISAIFELARDINTQIKEPISHAATQGAYNLLMELCNVLGIVGKENKKELLDEQIQQLIENRNQARKNKDFTRADAIRDELKAQGIILEDTREGVKWKREN